jgi:hypothetical protein
MESMPNMELLARETSVRTRTDLAAFVDALREDLLESENSRENPTLDRYLEALAAWVRDMPGYFKNQGIEEPHEPSWRLVATILHGAKTYE